MVRFPISASLFLEKWAVGVVANSVDGDLYLKLPDGPLLNPISLATVDGDILIVARRVLDAKITASTIDGKFESAYPVMTQGKGNKRSTRWFGVKVDGVMGAGGPVISLRTIDGDVEIVDTD